MIDRPLERFMQKTSRQGYKIISKSGWFTEDGNSQKIMRRIKPAFLEGNGTYPDRFCLYYENDELDVDHPLSIWFTNPVKLKNFIHECNQILEIMRMRKIKDL